MGGPSTGSGAAFHGRALSVIIRAKVKNGKILSVGVTKWHFFVHQRSKT